MPDDSPKFRTPLACRLAGIDRGWFNSAVAKQQYNCAPPAKGNTRIFQWDDVVRLYLFGVLFRQTMSIEKAGTLACDIVHVAERSESTRVVLLLTTDEGTRIIPERDFVPDHKYRPHLIYSTVFDLVNVRALLAERWENERHIYGEEE